MGSLQKKIQIMTIETKYQIKLCKFEKSFNDMEFKIWNQFFFEIAVELGESLLFCHLKIVP